jgi:hypothetical protein
VTAAIDYRRALSTDPAPAQNRVYSPAETRLMFG